MLCVFFPGRQLTEGACVCYSECSKGIIFIWGMRNEAPNCTRVEVIHVDFRLSAHVTGDAETRKTGEENRWRWMSAVVRGCPQPLSGLILSVSVLLILIAPGSHQLQHCCEVFLLLNSYQRASGLLVQSILSRPSLGHGHGGGGGGRYMPRHGWHTWGRHSPFIFPSASERTSLATVALWHTPH